GLRARGRAPEDGDRGRLTEIGALPPVPAIHLIGLPVPGRPGLPASTRRAGLGTADEGGHDPVAHLQRLEGRGGASWTLGCGPLLLVPVSSRLPVLILPLP